MMLHISNASTLLYNCLLLINCKIKKMFCLTIVHSSKIVSSVEFGGSLLIVACVTVVPAAFRSSVNLTADLSLIFLFFNVRKILQGAHIQ